MRQDVRVVLELYVRSVVKATLKLQRRLTVANRIDGCDAHDVLNVLWTEVAEAKGATFERAIVHQGLQMGPEFTNLTLLWDERVVNQKHVRDETEPGNRLLDTSFYVLGGGHRF